MDTSFLQDIPAWSLKKLYPNPLTLTDRTQQDLTAQPKDLEINLVVVSVLLSPCQTSGQCDLREYQYRDFLFYLYRLSARLS